MKPLNHKLVLPFLLFTLTGTAWTAQNGDSTQSRYDVVTSGTRALDNTVFYMRLGQRIIHILETRMALGQLYEVDMRLRPDGDSGTLVPSLERFARYQQDDAWTWEHQALVRARFVAGDSGVADRFAGIREQVLCLPRNESEVAAEVVKMRRRMRDHLLPGEAPDRFHLKQGSGGIVDIEFIVQFAVLAWANRHPQLAHWSDNVRILETLAREELLPEGEAQALTEAYLQYRGAAHQLALQQQPGEVDAALFATEREQVVRCWNTLFAEAEAIE